MCLRSGLQNVTLTFVHGHAGIGGHERADSLASRAPDISGGALAPADISNAIRCKGRAADSRNDGQFSSVSRLFDFRVSCFVTRFKRNAGHMRSFKNQQINGTASRHVLPNFSQGNIGAPMEMVQVPCW